MADDVDLMSRTEKCLIKSYKNFEYEVQIVELLINKEKIKYVAMDRWCKTSLSSVKSKPGVEKEGGFKYLAQLSLKKKT